MTRARLTRDINRLDQQLTSQQAALQQRKAQSKQALHQISPLWLAGLGLTAGLLTGRIGFQGVFNSGALAVKAQQLIFGVIGQLISSVAKL